MHKRTRFKDLSILQKTTILLSLAVLIIACTQPSFFTVRPKPFGWLNSWMCIFLGWTGFLGGNYIATFFWLANPVYFIALDKIIKGKKIGIYLSLVAVLIAAGFMFLRQWLDGETGVYMKITSLQPGYFLWLGSFSILFLGTLLNNFVLSKKRKGSPDEQTDNFQK